MMSLILDGAWELGPGVAIRPERFGALVYSFHTRRLTFLKSKRLLEIVQTLADHPSGRAACAAAGVAESELGTYERALGTLVDSDVIVPRSDER